MKILNRVKRIIELSKAPEEISNERLKELLSDGPLGDGKAEILTPMTEEEYEEHVRNEENGWGKLKERFHLK